MMRVTQKQLSKLALQAVSDSRNRLQEKQQIALTGVRVQNPSDDPAAVARGRILGSVLSESDSHRTNINVGLARLQTAEQSLGDAGNLLARARELAQSMANGTLTINERRTVSLEVQELRKNMIDIINTKHNNEFVYANVNTESAPIAQNGIFNYDTNTYDGIRQIEIGPSQTGEIGASASNAFAQRAADPDSVDVVGTLQNLYDNLTSNDPDAIRGSIDELNTAFNQVLAERSRTGIRIQRLQNAETASEQSKTLFEKLRSDVLDADAAEAFSNLSLAETAMQSAVTVAARILGPTVLDVL